MSLLAVIFERRCLFQSKTVSFRLPIAPLQRCATRIVALHAAASLVRIHHAPLNGMHVCACEDHQATPVGPSSGRTCCTRVRCAAFKHSQLCVRVCSLDGHCSSVFAFVCALTQMIRSHVYKNHTRGPRTASEVINIPAIYSKFI